MRSLRAAVLADGYVCLDRGRRLLWLSAEDSVSSMKHWPTRLSSEKAGVQIYFLLHSPQHYRTLQDGFPEQITFDEGGGTRYYDMVHKHRIQNKAAAPTLVVTRGRASFYLRHRPRLVRAHDWVDHAHCSMYGQSGVTFLFCSSVSSSVFMIHCVLGYSDLGLNRSQPGGIKCGVKTATRRHHKHISNPD